MVGLTKKEVENYISWFLTENDSVDFRGTAGVVCFRPRIKILGIPTNVVGGIRGLQTKKDCNELLKENDRGGIQTYDSGGH